MLRSIGLALAAAALTPTSLAAAPDLPRRATLGVGLAPTPDGGIMVQQVLPGLTGASLGLQSGDVIVKAGDTQVASPQALAAYIASVAVGETASLEIRRAGKLTTVSGKTVARPFESYPGAEVDYGAVPFKSGLLRDIMVMPQGKPDAPVVFLMQGFTCASIESSDPQDTYRQLAAHLSKRGIGFYRVEKPQVGDSRGGPDCAKIDFQEEVEGFRAAYKHLVEERGIEPSRIFMLGHSLGGLQAPLLASEHAPRGVAVYGTALFNWADYYQDAATIQSFIYAGGDPVENMALGETSREAIRRYFIDKESPADIVAARPELEPTVREVIGWQGGEMGYAGRHWKFLQSLANLPLAAAWRDTRSEVLSLYGEDDMVALFDTDQKLIADIVNHYRPGTASFVQMDKSDHDMRLLEVDRAGFRKYVSEKGTAPKGPFNERIAETLVEWIKQTMAKAPVSG